MTPGEIRPHFEISPTVRSVMTSTVATVTEQATLLTVAKLLAKKHISCVVVVKDKAPLGIISERDVVKAVADPKVDINTHTVEEIMSAPVESLPASTPLEKAVQLMQAKGYRRFPILDQKGNLAGIVTQTDVLRAFTRELEVAHDRMRDMAIHDGLTGLYNRRFFMEAVSKQFLLSRRYGDPIALILLDLDNFKLVNDQMGHQVGDEVLRGVSAILKSNPRKSDTTARFGGEEFTILAAKLDLAGAMRVAERLRVAIAQGGHTASFGVAVYPDPHAKTVEDLIRHADLAMYHAKTNGKNRVSAWTPEMEEFTDVRK